MYIFLYFFIFMIVFLFFLRALNTTSLWKTTLFTFFTNTIFYFILFYTLSLLTLIYNLFEFFLNNFYFVKHSLPFIKFFDVFYESFLFNIFNFNLNLAFIYYFPFMYIFILITTLSLLFCLSYNINEIVSFTLYCLLILAAGTFLFFTDSIILFFFAYEMLLIPSFFILYKFAKTRRCVEAAYLMFFWTQFGALFLLFSFLYLFFLASSSSFLVLSTFRFSSFEINFFFTCWIVGFGVKLPLWPFYGWLPKAHVEASTNFSIFLSGVLVKFAFFGLLKCLLCLQLEPTFFYVYPFLVIGVVDSAFKLFYQIDLKKLVAYSTVVEMHWLTICVISGQSCLLLANFCMLISHALLSTNSFLLVDAINRRFKTRLITEISGVNFLCPKLFVVAIANCLVFLGFPGTIFFIAEFLFFSFFFDLFPMLCLFFLILLYLLVPSFFFRSWINVLFGTSSRIKKSIPIDLSNKEFCLYSGIVFLMFWLGFTWQSFLF